MWPLRAFTTRLKLGCLFVRWSVPCMPPQNPRLILRAEKTRVLRTGETLGPRQME